MAAQLAAADRQLGLLALVILLALAAAALHAGGSRPLLAVVLVCTAYPAIRQLVDGNIEFLVIGGALLLLWALPRQHTAAFALGVLMCSAKFQESWLLLGAQGLAAWQRWPRPQFVRMLTWVAMPALALLAWRGPEWLAALRQFPFAGTQIDASLQAVTARLGLPVWVYVLLMAGVGLASVAMLRRSQSQVGQLQAGGLLAAGLLLAPYAASNSVLSPLALAGSALLVASPALGALLFALASIPYLLMGNLAWRLHSESDYWAFVLLLILLAALRALNPLSKPTKLKADS